MYYRRCQNEDETTTEYQKTTEKKIEYLKEDRTPKKQGLKNQSKKKKVSYQESKFRMKIKNDNSKSQKEKIQMRR